jgi:hypothetical protein
LTLCDGAHHFLFSDFASARGYLRNNRDTQTRAEGKTHDSNRKYRPEFSSHWTHGVFSLSGAFRKFFEDPRFRPLPLTENFKYFLLFSVEILMILSIMLTVCRDEIFSESHLIFLR